MARAAGVREATVSLGASELEAGTEPLGRARKPGGGRKRLADLDPGLRPTLLKRAGHRIEPAATPLTTLPDITAYESAHGLTLTPKTKPAR